MHCPFCNQIDTKVIDSRLAAEGVVFENAYTTSPLCSPARATVMNGLLPSRTGVYDNAAEFPSSIPTMAHYLRHAGYRTILCGKMHFIGPDQLHGYEERLTTDIYPSDFAWTPDWTRGPEHRPTGVVIARLHGVETIREFISGAAVTLLLDLPFLLIFLAVMFLYSWQLSLIAVGLLGAVALLSFFAAPAIRGRLNAQFMVGARNQAFLTEYLAGMATVKSLQLEPDVGKRYG